MKLAENIIKLGLAIAAVAGIAYVIVKYMDAIKAWAEKLCPCCKVEEEIEVEVVTEQPAEEAPAAEETPVAEEAPAVEEVVVEDGTPVAEETDFEA